MNRRISFERLESRTLLTDPTISVFAPTRPVVGGSEDIQVIFNQQVTSVTYRFSGPAPVIESQIWTNEGASYVSKTSDVHSWKNTSPPQDSELFYWPALPGSYSVSITVVGQTVFTKTLSFEVVAPTVTEFSVSAPNPQFGSPESGVIGFYQDNSVRYKAEIPSNPVPGVFGFVQLVNWRIEADSHSLNFPGSLRVLSEYNSPYLNDYFEKFNSGGPNTLKDSSSVQVLFPIRSFTHLQFSIKLSTYLDYQPYDGIHVQLASSSLSMGGEAVLKDNIPIFQVRSSPGTTVQGILTPLIISWDTDLTLAKRKYAK